MKYYVRKNNKIIECWSLNSAIKKAKKFYDNPNIKYVEYGVVNPPDFIGKLPICIYKFESEVNGDELSAEV